MRVVPPGVGVSTCQFSSDCHAGGADPFAVIGEPSKFLFIFLNFFSFLLLSSSFIMNQTCNMGRGFNVTSETGFYSLSLFSPQYFCPWMFDSHVQWPWGNPHASSCFLQTDEKLAGKIVDGTVRGSISQANGMDHFYST